MISIIYSSNQSRISSVFAFENLKNLQLVVSFSAIGYIRLAIAKALQYTVKYFLSSPNPKLYFKLDIEPIFLDPFTVLITKKGLGSTSIRAFFLILFSSQID